MSNNSGIRSPSAMNQKIHGSKKDFFQKDPFKEFTEQKLKEMLQKEDLETIIQIRQQAIEHKMNDRIEILDNLLREKTLSPRTYENKKHELQLWADEQNNDLKQKIIDIQQNALSSKTKRDLEFESQKQGNNLSISQINFNRFSKDQIKEDSIKIENQNEQQKQDEKVQSLNQGLIQKGGVKLYLDEDDFENEQQNKLQNNQINDQKQDQNLNQSQTQDQQIDDKNDEQQFLENEGQIYQKTQNGLQQQNQQNEELKNSINADDLYEIESDKFMAKSCSSGEIEELERENKNQEEQKGKMEIKVNNRKFLRQNIMFQQQQQQINEDIDEENQNENQDQDQDKQVNEQSARENREREAQQIMQQEQQTQQHMMEQMFMEMNQEMKERWKMQGFVDSRVQEQMDKLYYYDKSDNYGICTNQFVIKDYLQYLIQFVVDNYQDEFLNNINIPFGFQPSKRLKLIHGYDNFIEDQNQQENQQESEEYITLPFVLSEELFIKFEQSIIGNGETEKEQIIKEFEHIHNKSIFDSFNEALNTFRPYYLNGGPPYSWSKQEKQIINERKSFIQQNLDKIFKQCQMKVLNWGQYLCGIVNEGELYFQEEEQRQFSIKNIDFDPNRPLASIMAQMPPEHDVFVQVKEEKLSKLLLDEINENEFKWCLFEDEKAEVVMELSDLVFEDLVENFIEELYKDKIDEIRQAQLLDQQDYQEKLMREVQMHAQLEQYTNQDEQDEEQEEDENQEEEQEDYDQLYQNQNKYQQIGSQKQKQEQNDFNQYNQAQINNQQQLKNLVTENSQNFESLDKNELDQGRQDDFFGVRKIKTDIKSESNLENDEQNIQGNDNNNKKSFSQQPSMQNVDDQYEQAQEDRNLNGNQDQYESELI